MFWAKTNAQRKKKISQRSWAGNTDKKTEKTHRKTKLIFLIGEITFTLFKLTFNLQSIHKALKGYNRPLQTIQHFQFTPNVSIFC
jgi:hypothetical protein